MAAPAIPTIVIPCGNALTLNAGFALPVQVTCQAPQGGAGGPGGGIVITFAGPDEAAPRPDRMPSEWQPGDPITLRTTSLLLSERADLAEAIRRLSDTGSPITVLLEE
jgi:hypothetical protein